MPTSSLHCYGNNLVCRGPWRERGGRELRSLASFLKYCLLVSLGIICVFRANFPLYTPKIITSVLIGHPWQNCTKGWLPSVQIPDKMLPLLLALRLSVTVGSTQKRYCSPTLLLPVLALLSRKRLLHEKFTWQCPWVPSHLYAVAGEPGIGERPTGLFPPSCFIRPI